MRLNIHFVIYDIIAKIDRVRSFLYFKIGTQRSKSISCKLYIVLKLVVVGFAKLPSNSWRVYTCSQIKCFGICIISRGGCNSYISNSSNFTPWLLSLTLVAPLTDQVTGKQCTFCSLRVSVLLLHALMSISLILK